MNRPVAVLLGAFLAAVAVGLAAQPDWRLGEMALRDSLVATEELDSRPVRLRIA
jgi:hypothetical protein